MLLIVIIILRTGEEIVVVVREVYGNLDHIRSNIEEIYAEWNAKFYRMYISKRFNFEIRN